MHFTLSNDDWNFNYMKHYEKFLLLQFYIIKEHEISKNASKEVPSGSNYRLSFFGMKIYKKTKQSDYPKCF